MQVEYECEVIALTIDMGQTADNLEEIKAKALKVLKRNTSLTYFY